MLLTAFTSLLIVNILRIVLLGSLYNLGSIWGDPLHTFFWYFLSIAFVIGIWFAQVKIFKVKDIPFYTDLRFLFRNSLINKKRSKKKKTTKKKKPVKKKSKKK